MSSGLRSSTITPTFSLYLGQLLNSYLPTITFPDLWISPKILPLSILTSSLRAPRDSDFLYALNCLILCLAIRDMCVVV